MARQVIARRYRNLYRYPMKTTLDINNSLLANAKALAARQRTSLTRLIEEGLQLRLRSAHVATKANNRKRKIPVFKGRGGLVAGVNPISNKSMLDAASDAELAAAVIQFGEHLVTLDADFRKLLRRTQLTVLIPG